MKILPLRDDLYRKIVLYGLVPAWDKAVKLFECDHRYPSLHAELLEPKHHGIHSFRINQKYRALFFVKDGRAEVFQITNHYR